MDSCVGRHLHLPTRHLRFVSLNNCLLMRSALMSQTRPPWYDRSPCELRTGDPATARPWVGGVLDSETNCGVHSAPRASCVLSEAKQQVQGRRASPRLSRRRGAGFPLCSCTARCRPPAAASCLLTGFSPGIRRSLPPPAAQPPHPERRPSCLPSADDGPSKREFIDQRWRSPDNPPLTHGVEISERNNNHF